MNGTYIFFCYISSRRTVDLECTVKKQEAELEKLKRKFDGIIGKVGYIESTDDKAKNAAE